MSSTKYSFVCAGVQPTINNKPIKEIIMILNLFIICSPLYRQVFSMIMNDAHNCTEDSQQAAKEHPINSQDTITQNQRGVGVDEGSHISQEPHILT